MAVWRVIGRGLVLAAVCALPHASRGEETAASPAARGGMEAHVDPRTGRLLPEPAAPPLARLPVAPLQAADVPAPGGGMMVHLNGQFMSRLVATVDADGRVHLDCVTGDGRHAHPGE